MLSPPPSRCTQHLLSWLCNCDSSSTCRDPYLTSTRRFRKAKACFDNQSEESWAMVDPVEESDEKRRKGPASKAFPNLEIHQSNGESPPFKSTKHSLNHRRFSLRSNKEIERDGKSPSPITLSHLEINTRY
ncbi:hypothetical protein L1987_57588 [Smallanthus sonchifolius]|uniref:Uncharacterized protein n=1 Tax=Smallanthus sonchifolius TaxID=185202 RepID=A0ACB9DDJ2_9ASTR|nr:hypothetical protein L1987_57588 [Smallanthus sonchifolius]